MKKIILGIDAGDFIPGSEVNSGIKRLIKQFIEKIKNYPEYVVHYYYFSNEFPQHSVIANIHYVRMPSTLYGSVHLPLGSLIRRDSIFFGFSGYIPQLPTVTNSKKIAFIHDFGFYKYP